jgi:hypothetical protein
MSAADKIKETLINLIKSTQPAIVESAPVAAVGGPAADNLYSSLVNFFTSVAAPAALVTGVAIPEIREIRVFKYGSGDADDVINVDANDIDTDLFVKSCRRADRGYILLIFSVEDLFKKCMRYTLMKSRVVDFQMQNQGEHLANLIALTEDEFEFFGDDFLYNAAIAVHNEIGAYGRDLGVQSMVFDIGSVSSPGTVIYAVRIPEKGFFHNYVVQLHENISSALYYSVLQQWAMWCNDAGEIQSNTAKYTTSSSAIMSFINVGCPRITRPTRYF